MYLVLRLKQVAFCLHSPIRLLVVDKDDIAFTSRSDESTGYVTIFILSQVKHVQLL
jgi:hypothetical protein